jgi:hypothetical protein
VQLDAGEIAASAPEPMDLANPYAPSAAPLSASKTVWLKLEDRCNRLGSTVRISWGIAAGAAFIGCFSVERWWLGIPFTGIATTVLVLIWMFPTHPKVLAFARQLVLARGVPPERVRDEQFVEVLSALMSKGRRGVSEGIGFLHLTEAECTLRLHEHDIVIPEAKLQRVQAIKPKRYLLPLLGGHFIEITWQPEDEAEPKTLYVVGGDGETVFGLKRATQRIYEQLTAWSQQPTASMASQNITA